MSFVIFQMKCPACEQNHRVGVPVPVSTAIPYVFDCPANVVTVPVEMGRDGQMIHGQLPDDCLEGRLAE